MSRRLFKYVTVKTALSILQNRTLKWSAPELFNDPFEFKSPFEFGFEYEDFREPLIDAVTRLVTQPNQPDLVEGAPTTFIIRNARIQYAAKRGAEPADIRRLCQGFTPSLINWLREQDAGYRELWRKFKKQYRVLCFSEVPDNILMWSHYAEEHSGAVLGFDPHLESRSELAEAKAVCYSKAVPTMATLDQFVAYLTSQGPKPISENALEKCVFSKSADWCYEKEWRVFRKDPPPNTELFSYRPFDPSEVVAIYFGCRALEKSKDEIIGAAKSLGTQISYFQMKDERIRFELTRMPLTI